MLPDMRADDSTEVISILSPDCSGRREERREELRQERRGLFQTRHILLAASYISFGDHW